MSTPDLPWKYMRELDIVLWKTWKKSDLTKIEFHLFRSFQYQSSSFRRVWPQKQHIQINGSGTFIWITMSPLEVVSSRKSGSTKMPDFHTSRTLLCLKRTVFWVSCQMLYEFYMKDGSLKHMMTWWCEFWKDQHRYPNATISFLYLASFTSIHSLLVRL